MQSRSMALIGAVVWGITAVQGHAVTTVFFNPSQIATPAGSGPTSETIHSEGYEFTYSVDKYWSPSPGGPPTGRFFVVHWPDGVQAQGVTAGPTSPQAAKITLSRVDGNLFDISSLTFKILGNTYGAGAAIEIMPLLDGEDGFPDPLALDATGFYGQSFSYNTPTLTNFDTYKFSLYVDFALTQLTLVDDSGCLMGGDTDGDGDVDFNDFLNVQNFFGDGGPNSPGDADCDGDCDFDDFLAVYNFFGTPGPGIMLTPEPASIGLLTVGGLALLARRRA